MLKAKAKAAFRKWTTGDGRIQLKRAKRQAVEDMIWAWNNRDPSVIESAWEQYRDSD
jgi:hypothetical protein